MRLPGNWTNGAAHRPSEWLICSRFGFVIFTLSKEIPLEATQPATPRAPYTGQKRTAGLSSQAMDRIHAIPEARNALLPYQLDDQLSNEPDNNDTTLSPPSRESTLSIFGIDSLGLGGNDSSERSESFAPGQPRRTFSKMMLPYSKRPRVTQSSGLAGTSGFGDIAQIHAAANTSSPAFTGVSTASPCSLLSTNNGNIPSPSQVAVLQDGRRVPRSRAAYFQPSGPPRHRLPTALPSPLNPLSEVPSNVKLATADSVSLE